jgi:hypothetical protein
VANRVKAGTATFARPFLLRRFDRELPAGTYAVETEEESLEGASALSYRRVEIRLFVPWIAGKSEAEMWVLSPGELDAALALDREPAGKAEAESAPRATHRAVVTQKAKELPMRSHNKGGNLPLYGSLVGILALFLATIVFGQHDPGEDGPPPVRAADASPGT